jgi:diacylglycerol O-acyltransferase 1
MKSATSTSVETSNGPATHRNGAVPDKTLTSVEPKDGTTIQKLRASPQKKYRHVAAVHSQTRPSCLSHDSKAAPSFLGFRNLMVIVLGESPIMSQNIV